VFAVRVRERGERERAVCVGEDGPEQRRLGVFVQEEGARFGGVLERGGDQITEETGECFLEGAVRTLEDQVVMASGVLREETTFGTLRVAQ
jgi:hypothetical protein